jgi:Fic family protein
MDAELFNPNLPRFVTVPGTPYQYDSRMSKDLGDLADKIKILREAGSLTPAALRRLRQYFRIKNIYHSNAIEGNLLDYGETRVVVQEGLTITGKPLKDTLEAKNLAHALDLFEQLADREGEPIRAVDIRNIHRAILRGIDDEVAGKYRTVQVEVTGSHFRPPGPERVSSMMDEFCRWLEPHTLPPNASPSVDPLILSCAAHAWFVYIHPFADGNGRTARILMNLLLMRYGYPIAVITKDDRQRYYDALEESQSSDLTPFAGLVLECVEESLEEYQRAADEERLRHEWAESIAAKLGAVELARAKNEYEVWKSAMDLVKGYSREAIELLNEQAAAHGLIRLYFKDFGTLEFEKYLSLRNRESAKKTWFFRLDFRSGERSARYLFFFGFPSFPMEGDVGPNAVTLHVAKETAPFFYERLSEIESQGLPLICEIGYRHKRQEFVAKEGTRVREIQVEPAIRNFIEQIAKRDF